LTKSSKFHNQPVRNPDRLIEKTLTTKNTKRHERKPRLEYLAPLPTFGTNARIFQKKISAIKKRKGFTNA